MTKAQQSFLILEFIDLLVLSAYFLALPHLLFWHWNKVTA